MWESFNWDPLSVFLSLVSIALAYWIFIRTPNKRVLEYVIHPLIPLLNPSSPTSEALKVMYDDEEVTSPVLSSFTFQSTGNKAIAPEDWNVPIRLIYPEDVRVVEFYMTYDNDPIYATGEIEEQRVELNKFLMNKGDTLTLYVLTDGTSEPELEIKILDGVVKARTPRGDLDTHIRLTFVGLTVINFIIAYIISFYDRSYWGTAVSGFFLLLGLFCSSYTVRTILQLRQRRTAYPWG